MKFLVNIILKLTVGQRTSIAFTGFGGLLIAIATIFKKNKNVQKKIATASIGGMLGVVTACCEWMIKYINKMKIK